MYVLFETHDERERCVVLISTLEMKGYDDVSKFVFKCVFLETAPYIYNGNYIQETLEEKMRHIHHPIISLYHLEHSDKH